MSMNLDWNVHSPMGGNTWHPLEDAAPDTDPKTLLTTLTLPVIFKGSRGQLNSMFAFGKQNAPHGGTGMFCIGPKGMKLKQYTDQQPHWVGEVTWVGLYESGSSGRAFAFVSSTKWSARETTFPQSVTLAGASAEISYSPGAPVAPNGNNGTTGKPWRARRLDSLPVRELRGISFTSVEPHPTHPHITAAASSWMPPAAGNIAGYQWIPDPVFVTWAGFKAQSAPATPPAVAGGGSAPGPGNWFCREVDTVDRYAPLGTNGAATSIYVIQATFSWEQLRQVS